MYFENFMYNKKKIICCLEIRNFSSRVEKLFTHLLCSLMKYFSTWEEKFCISKQPCNILYHIHCNATVSCSKMGELIIEGLRAKRAYIEFWPIFIFCRIELIFGRLTCFGMKSIIPWLFRSICASFSRNNVCKKTQLSSGDLLFNEKQKKPFVSLSFVSHTITVICYFCFVSASDWGAVRG